ncbi:probable membrane-associated 30 kDa protein, chloroplastic [Selaginella moellendorffii]|nr:probable membrane-associated 30 kDa protein, chloroplastic [Selaginella moellendorffii]XP_024539053.1 probable membrane-associated 30 kDa protein, chloroplastic [Selaginella moellendorffii]|eukprot:XP_002978623.2 probable membrane-associated 30 kDa protein, chloroplastic [Selaginella moellendorffii]
MAAIGAPIVCAGKATGSSFGASCKCQFSPVTLVARRNLTVQSRGMFLHSSQLSLSSRSRFFNGGNGISLLAAVVASSSRDGQGAMGARMNIFERVIRVVRSYVNAAVSAAEDPEKLLDQTVLEMNEDLIKMRQASAQVLASQKQLENKYRQAEENSQSWYKRAKLALEKGDEVLAREALKRRKDYEENAKALRTQLDQQKSVVEKLISSTRLLESKIQEARSKKDTLKARAQSARTSQKVNEMLGNINTSSALAAFEKMEEKVTALEAEADSLNELNTDELAGKFALLESDSVDDDLAALKQEMLGTSKKAGELPAGRSPVGSNAFADVEIEKELNELRRKTREL